MYIFKKYGNKLLSRILKIDVSLMVWDFDWKWKVINGLKMLLGVFIMRIKLFW